MPEGLDALSYRLTAFHNAWARPVRRGRAGRRDPAAPRPNPLDATGGALARAACDGSPGAVLAGPRPPPVTAAGGTARQAPLGRRPSVCGTPNVFVVHGVHDAVARAMHAAARSLGWDRDRVERVGPRAVERFLRRRAVRGHLRSLGLHADLVDPQACAMAAVRCFGQAQPIALDGAGRMAL